MPNPESIKDLNKENSGTAEQNITWYQQIRLLLLVKYGTKYVSQNGQIKDYVLVAFIIALEAGTLRGSVFNDFYDATLSAVSQQYHTSREQGASSSSVCNGSCTIVEQLIWMQGFHVFRTQNSKTTLFNSSGSQEVFWEGFITDAKRATNSPLSADGKRYWGFGNLPGQKGDFRIEGDLTDVTGTGYYQVYGFSYGWIK